MDDQPERRRHRRVRIRLPIECVGEVHGRPLTYRTVTRDVSSSGISFEVENDEFPVGALLEMELKVPPGDGHSSSFGRVRGVGQVVRVDPVGDNGDAPRFRIAAHFNQPLKLVF